MRWQDKEEVYYYNGLNPFEALLKGYQEARFCQSSELQDKCIAMFGVTDSQVEGDTGVIWLLSNQELQKYKMYKIKYAKTFLKKAFITYKKLMNFTHDDTQSDTIEWLKFLGFEFVERVEILMIVTKIFGGLKNMLKIIDDALV